MYVDSERITGQAISIRSDDVAAVSKDGDQKVGVLLNSMAGQWILLRDDFDSFKRRLSQAFHALP